MTTEDTGLKSQQKKQMEDLLDAGGTSCKFMLAGGAPLTQKQYSASHSVLLQDVQAAIEMNSGSANTLTVPADASVNLPLGTTILVTQTGAGATTVAAGAGATVNVNAALTLVLNGQWAQASLYKQAANTWVLSGNLVAA